MIRRFCLLLIAVALLLCCAPIAHAQDAFPITGTVNVNANLRSGAGTGNAIVGKASSGQQVKIVAANDAGDWYKLDGGAWIAAQLVTLNEPTAPVAPPTTLQPAERQLATVVGITDGDTISVNVDGVLEELRYIGIDTPERNQPGYRAASEANRKLVEGQTVYLAKDVSDRDRYGRLLRYVYLPDETFVNAELVGQGWAQPVAYPPDTAQHAGFEQKAVEAAHARRGFWSGASPYDGAMPYALTKVTTPLSQGPGAGNAITTQLATNTSLTVFGRSSDGAWLQVRTPLRVGGWVAANAVTLNVPVTKLAVTGSSSAVAPTDAQGARSATVTGQANLRSGPGTNYPVSGSAASGEKVTITGCNADGQWLQLASGAWVAAFLVTGAPDDIPVVAPSSSFGQAGATNPTVAATPQSTPQPTAVSPTRGDQQWTTYTCEDNPSPPPNPACPIKGNISSNGQIYHMPGQAFYCKTVIDTSAGERWFCSAAEAEAAGWRAAQR